MSQSQKAKGQWGGKRPGAGRKKGSTYSERQEIAGIILGLNNLEHRKALAKMFAEDLTLIQSPAFRFLAPYFFGKVPDPEVQQGSGKGLMVAFLKGALGEYDPLAHRMPKALPAAEAVVIEQAPAPDPNHPEIVDLPEPL